MTNTDWRSALDAVPVVPVLRGLAAEAAVAVGRAALDGGLRLVEITLDSPGACDAITALAAAAPAGAAIGAGTVVTTAEVDAAVAAGATFLVAPHFDPAVVAYALAQGVPIVPGVATPSELAAAVRAGASMVKLFPAAPLGGGYLAALRGPYPDVAIMVSGGVTVSAAAEWLRAGATAVGIGVSALGRAPDDVRENAAKLVSSLGLSS